MQAAICRRFSADRQAHVPGSQINLVVAVKQLCQGRLQAAGQTQDENGPKQAEAGLGT